MMRIVKQLILLNSALVLRQVIVVVTRCVASVKLVVKWPFGAELLAMPHTSFMSCRISLQIYLGGTRLLGRFHCHELFGPFASSVTSSNC